MNRNPMKQAGLGKFFQPIEKKRNDGTTVLVRLPETPLKLSNDNWKIPCKAAPLCTATFKTTQGLGSHLNMCHYYRMKSYEEQAKSIHLNGNIFCTSSINEGKRQRIARNSEVIQNHTSTVQLDASNNVRDGEIVDKRKYNRGSSQRSVYSDKQKWDLIEACECWLDDNEEKTVMNYIKENRLPMKMKDFLSTGKNGWRYPATRDRILKNATDKYKLQFQVPCRGFIYRAKYQSMENSLKEEMKARRHRGAKVSSFWLRHRAKALVTELYPGRSFSASNGWLFRFMRRHKIKFRRTKNVKSQSAEEKRSKIMEWHQKIRYDVLPYREGHVGQYHPYYGRFPPEKRYNMDQIPMPFVVEQGTTFTFEDDEHVHVRGAGSESLVKRQFTAHVFINAAKEEVQAKGYIDMICRGTGTRISRLEKQSYNNNVNVRFQPKAWVDRNVMKEIATDFVQFKRENHGDDHILLICDNLDAHCCEEVLEIFANANILVWFVVPACTDLIQPIDAGIGRSIRIYVGHALDKWLSVDDNLDLWEGNLSASERRILMSNFLAEAMQVMLSDDKSHIRIGAFERIGCLIELSNRQLADGTLTDDKVKPQGLLGKYTIPLRMVTPLGGDHRENLTIVPNEVLPPETIDDIVGHEHDGTGELNDLLVTENENDTTHVDDVFEIEYLNHEGDGNNNLENDGV